MQFWSPEIATLQYEALRELNLIYRLKLEMKNKEKLHVNNKSNCPEMVWVG